MRALQELLSWENYDCIDGWFHVFTNVKLKQPIGNFSAGTQFPSATFDVRLLVLHLDDFNGSYIVQDKRHSFKVTIITSSLSRVSYQRGK